MWPFAVSQLHLSVLLKATPSRSVAAAPLHFVSDLPWWLIIARPMDWEASVEDWVLHQSQRSEIWPKLVRKAEVKNAGPERTFLLPDMPLFRHMCENGGKGQFGVHISLRTYQYFEVIRWKVLGERFFGKRPVDISREQWWILRHQLLSDRQCKLVKPVAQRRKGTTERKKAGR